VQKEEQVVASDKELADFEQQALRVEQQTSEMEMVIKDFEGIREENIRLKDQAEEAQ
jgi:hypothetical protein